MDVCIEGPGCTRTLVFRQTRVILKTSLTGTPVVRSALFLRIIIRCTAAKKGALV